MAASSIKPANTIRYGTVAYTKLLTQLVARNEQALLARKGEILLQHEGKTLLVQNIFPAATETGDQTDARK